jgi:hypothetical protein
VKTVWKTPELVALVRTKPEERVLVACKTSAASDPRPALTADAGPNDYNVGCYYASRGPVPAFSDVCTECSDLTTS